MDVVEKRALGGIAAGILIMALGGFSPRLQVQFLHHEPVDPNTAFTLCTILAVSCESDCSDCLCRASWTYTVNGIQNNYTRPYWRDKTVPMASLVGAARRCVYLTKAPAATDYIHVVPESTSDGDWRATILLGSNLICVYIGVGVACLSGAVLLYVGWKRIRSDTPFRLG